MNTMCKAFMSLGMWWFASALAADSGEVVEFKVSAQPLSEALDAWAVQSGWQFIAPGRAVDEERESPGVIGAFTAREGLEQLLANSTLAYDFVDARTVSLRDGTSPTWLGSAATLRGQEFALAAAVAPTSSAAIEEGRTTIALDEIVVTGTRLRDPSEGPTHVTVFDRKRLDQLGAATVAELVQYLSEQPYLFANSFTSTGAQFLEVRGLGLGSTLVLINGRRVTPSAAVVAFNAFDVNMIPMAAVERIEVLAESASAVYGADAMGGVMNIVLKQDLTRPVLELRYGGADGGADEQRASLSSGIRGEHGRGSLVLDYFARGSLLGRERPSFGDQDFRRFGGVDRRTLNSNPGNISARGGGNLPGVGARFAAVPDGSSGVGLTPADFVATAGQRRLTSFNQYRAVVPEARRVSAAGFGELELGSSMSAFADLLFVDSETDSQIDPASVSGVAVPASNAFNPFGVAVTANFLLTSLGPRHIVTETELARGALGLRGLLGNWDWEVSVMRSEEEGSQVTRNGIDVARRNGALASNDPATALNVFQDGPGGSPEFLRSLIATPVPELHESVGTLVSAFARGALLSLPTGEVEAVIGAEWRDESMFFDEDFVVDADRNVVSAFSELRVPLVNEGMDVSALHALTLTAAVRYDEYSDFGSTVNPQVGLTWWLTPQFMLRAAYGTGFRAPSLFELHAPRSTFPQPVVDPRRNNEVVDVIAVSGGNPDLDPIESTFTTAGLLWSPTNSLRASLDFFRIRLDERVAFFSHDLVLANESRYPQRVVRATPTPADVAAGLPGQILSVDVSRINFGTVDTRGMDLEFTWTWRTAWGAFTPTLSATWLDRYDTVDLPQTPVVDRIGRASQQGTITRWRAVGTLAWSLGPGGASLTARHTPGYVDYDAIAERFTGHRLDSRTLVDVQASLDVDEWLDVRSVWLRGMKLSAGVVNLFDEVPEFAAIGVSTGFDISQGELRQRFGYVQLTKRF